MWDLYTFGICQLKIVTKERTGKGDRRRRKVCVHSHLPWYLFSVIHCKTSCCSLPECVPIIMYRMLLLTKIHSIYSLSITSRKALFSGKHNSGISHWSKNPMSNPEFCPFSCPLVLFVILSCVILWPTASTFLCQSGFSVKEKAEVIISLPDSSGTSPKYRPHPDLPWETWSLQAEILAPEEMLEC